MRKIIAPLALVTILAASAAIGQDSQALGDAARQVKQQKQAKAAQSQTKDSSTPKAPKVITNEELPANFHPGAKVSDSDPERSAVPPSESSQHERKISAEQWKTQIAGQENVISNLQSQIDQLSESIRFAPANCVSNCAHWNQRQREKEQQIETMKARLADQEKKLEDMQEQARKQGYGSSVYEP
jgi:hypothetical protein